MTVLDNTGTESEPTVDRTHPLGTGAGKVVVGGHQVCAFAGEGIECECQCGHERFTFPCLHFGDPAEVERCASDDLYIVVPHAEVAYRGFADEGKCLGHDALKRLPSFQMSTFQLYESSLQVGNFLDF